MSMNEHDQIKRAGGSDIADWGEKVTKGAYAKGTTFTINGKSFDPEQADAIVAGEKSERKRKRRAPLRRS